MSPQNAANRIVWADLPVADLDRAARFYAAVLGVKVAQEAFGDMKYALLEHHEGNGACLVVKPQEVAADRGILVYFNANGRLRDAVRQTEVCGGAILQAIHSIGPHGFRALVRDSEGNRIALHSETDA